MKDIIVLLLSLVLTSLVMGNAYLKKKQLYPAVAYISKSGPSMLIIYFQGLVFAMAIAKQLSRLLFGQLRVVERERIIEKAKYTVTDTCLAFASFRSDFGPRFVSLFTLLFFVKVFHWLTEERVDFMERSPVITVKFHVRILSSFLLLGALDLLFIKYVYDTAFDNGLSPQIVFGFEYAILLNAIISLIIKYTLHTIDVHNNVPWEYKSVFLLYSDLILSLVKVIIYVSFLLVMLEISTIPLFAFRNVYQTLKEINDAVRDIIQSRRAIRIMDTLYPDVTVEDLSVQDSVCIICRDEIVIGTPSKKMPCNHIFHSACLRSWLHRQQTCPICRLNILRPSTENQQQFQQLQRDDAQRRHFQDTLPRQYLAPNSLDRAGVHGDVEQSGMHSGSHRVRYSKEGVHGLEGLNSEELEERLRSMSLILDSITDMLRQYQIRSIERRTQGTQTSDDDIVFPQDQPSTSFMKEVIGTKYPKSTSSGDPKENIETPGSSLEELIRERRLKMFNKLSSNNDQEHT